MNEFDVMNDREEKYLNALMDDMPSKRDKFFINNYKQLLVPARLLEFARVINGMDVNELLKFNEQFHGKGAFDYATELLHEEVEELGKRTLIDNEICEAYLRINAVNGPEDINTIKDMFMKKGQSPDPLKMLFVLYPMFQEHFPIFNYEKIIIKTEDGWRWKKDKIALGQYFECLDCNDKRRRWAFIERTFGYKQGSLRIYVNNHKKQQRGKPAKDWEEIKKLLGI
ncbi:MAG: hypothetical protein LBQ88_12780 [Treponema sp.]|jgi:hypothetical protein|nr:hypothetical protein [Treponema sp.]